MFGLLKLLKFQLIDTNVISGAVKQKFLMNRGSIVKNITVNMTVNQINVINLHLSFTIFVVLLAFAYEDI